MLKLFYASQPTRPMTATELRSLVGSSQVSNRRKDVTGVLAFTGTYFAQVLEGPPDVVERLAARIAADPRHHAVRVLSRQEGGPRDFPEWNMQLLESPQLEAELAELLAAEGDGSALAAVALDRITREARWQRAGDMRGGAEGLSV